MYKRGKREALTEQRRIYLSFSCNMGLPCGLMQNVFLRTFCDQVTEGERLPRTERGGPGKMPTTLKGPPPDIFVA